ncbi:MAG: hypothetical protein A3D92_04485 [Bacteroidetes bacterium RIFCSPHIGHO2_02_FULL_44_7]|nr:MAG: hypothetical protein A3D92_04485 [Bacteroidetes bacterium RIFCSPHIGHO2_02_FULL_44_7]
MSNTTDMNKREDWIERHLESTEFVHPVEASDALMLRLRSIPVQMGRKVYLVPKRAIWSLVAGLAVLITVNLIALSNYERAQEVHEAGRASDTYFSYMKQL